MSSDPLSQHAIDGAARRLLPRTVLRRLDTLTALGTPAKIARFLHKQGIKGVPGNACHCPVARYLSTQRTTVVAGLTRIERIGGLGYVDTPPPVRKFMGQFDRRTFVKLIDLNPQEGAQ